MTSSTTEPEQQLMRSDDRTVAAAIAGGFVTLWLAHVLILPPFEGFDETAHYSYVSLLADEGRIPDFRQTPLDGTLVSELRDVPQPYAGQPPFEQNGGITYAAWFDPQNRNEATAAAQRLWSPPHEPARFTAGQSTNWQGQHPPLFYALLTLPYYAGADWSPGVRLLVMRLTCVAMSAGGLLFWYLLLRETTERRSRQLLLGAAGAVLLLPSCSFDLARLGNDSLASLLISAVACFTFRAVRYGRVRDSVATAVMCGAGLLTKAYFLPVTCGVACYFLLMRERTARRLLGLGIVTALPVLMSAAWFVFFYNRYGTLLGSHETWMLTRGPAVGESLTIFEFAWAMSRSVAAFGATFLWSGTWSWVQRPHWQYALMAPFILVAAVRLIRGVLSQRKHPPDETRTLAWIVVAILGPILLGFAYHIFMRVRYTGIGSGTGGYYLFVAWPLVGLTLAEVWNPEARRWGRVAIWGAVTSAVLFEMSGMWFSAQVYAGIIQKAGASKIGVGSVPFNISTLHEVRERLSLLAFPTAAMLFYFASLYFRVLVFHRLMRRADSTGQLHS